MDLNDAIKLRIKNICKEKKITLNKLATLSGITQSTLENIMTNNTKYPRIITISYICQGVQMELKDFFDDTLFKLEELEDNE